jgi:general nucleoside transport system permease protein
VSRTRIWEAAAIPIAAIILGIVVGGLIIFVSSPFVVGQLDPALPFVAYAALLEGAFGSVDKVIHTFILTAPIILTGLSVGIGFKAGLFNIGAAGQLLMGALGAGVVGAAVADWPPILAIATATLAAVALGGFWGFIPGVLKAYTGAHEVVTTIMLNFIAAAVVAALVTGPFSAPGFSFIRTDDIGNAAMTILIGPEGHVGLLVALLSVPIIWWLLGRTTWGFQIRTVGANPSAARYAGMNPSRVTIATMTLCGALAGLAGAIEILGSIGYVGASHTSSAGFDGITAALLGRAAPFGILGGAFMLGSLRAGAALMGLRAGIPVEIVDILQAVILLFLAADILVRRVFRIRRAKSGVSSAESITRSYAGERGTG